MRQAVFCLTTHFLSHRPHAECLSLCMLVIRHVSVNTQYKDRQSRYPNGVCLFPHIESTAIQS